MVESKTRPRSISGPLSGVPLLEDALADEELSSANLPGAGAVIDEKYRVDYLVARGGMGAVFAATNLVSGKRVALKWMLPALGQISGARERFVREACVTARIEHPNIVNIYDVGADQRSVYLVMEFLRGETLSERLERERLSEQEAIAILMPALRGVAAAHAHGVIHRDLKPDNIFLCRTPEGEPLEPKVLDFGISKIVDEETRDCALTRSGAVLGTPYYMSPEQVRGAHDVDERADVYAFGVMLYEALTGRRPFDAETYNQLILKIATETPVPAGELNPALTPELIRVLERAMARVPEERFASIEALALALEPFAGGARFRSGNTPQPYHARPVDPPQTLNEAHRTPLAKPSARPRRRVRAAAASALLLLLLGCVAVVWAYARRTTPELHASSGLVLPKKAAPSPQSQPQPTAAATLPRGASPPARDDSVETTTSAVSTPVASANAATAQGEHDRPRAATHPPAHKSGPAHGAAYRGWNEDPPAPSWPSAKHGLPSDWDDRLASEPVHAASDIPAGRIDARDFR